MNYRTSRESRRYFDSAHIAKPPAHFGIVPRHAGGLLYILSYAHRTVPFLKVKCMIPSASTVTFSTIVFHSVDLNSTTFSSLPIRCFTKDVSILRCQITRRYLLLKDHLKISFHIIIQHKIRFCYIIPFLICYNTFHSAMKGDEDVSLLSHRAQTENYC